MSTPVVPIARGKSSKKRRPAFRPAVSKKPTSRIQQPGKGSTVSAPIHRPVKVNGKLSPASAPALASADEINDKNGIRNGKTIITEKEAGVSAAGQSSQALQPKRKKRKGTIAIGISRPLREPEPVQEEPEESAITPQTTVVSETTIPPALPGQKTLSSFCSSYRSRQKNAKQKDAAAPAPPPPPEETDPVSAGPVVQLINGEIVLQESSMVVAPRRTVEEVEEEFQHVVEEETHTAVVGASYNSFVTRKAPQHWSVEETKLFYDALRQVGVDFATMTAFFKNRTRKQLKRKYQTEIKRQPDLITMALKPESQVPLDLSKFNVTEEDVQKVEIKPLPPPEPVKETEPEPKQTSETVVPEQSGTEPMPREEVVEETMETTGVVDFPEDPLEHRMGSFFPEEEDPAIPEDAFAVEAFDEFQIEKTPAATISLVPTKQKAKKKKPKFRAKGKARSK